MDRTHSEEERDDRTLDPHLTRRLLGYLRPYRLRVVGAIVLLMAGAAVEMVGPYLTKVAIDEAIPNGDLGLLSTLVAILVASLAIAFVLEYLQTVLTTWIGQRVMYDIRMEVFRHLQRMSLRFFDRNPVGRLMTRVTNDVEALNELFSSGVVALFGDLFTVIFIIVAMLLLDWRLALMTLAVLPFVFVVAFVFRGLIRAVSWDIRVRLARINAYLQENLTGIRVVQLFGRERESADRFERINRDHLDANLRSITYYAAFFPLIEILTAIAFALILWYGGLNTLDGTMSVGLVAAFLQYARRFFRPIQDLSEKYNLLQGAVASSERIFNLLDTRPDLNDPADPVPLPTPGSGEIEFRGVWFHYGDGPGPPATAAGPGEDGAGADGWVLRDVSFRISPGQRYAVVGATGSGKSTLISLLMRFYEPQRGEILFDGVPISSVRATELRERIGLVLQDVFLFNEEVRENIALGRAGADGDQVVRAARGVGAHEFIERLPEAYQQTLGERGASLSVGERQLISFARALAVSPLVLVLDEATSSVDSELESRIETALEALMRGRTTLVVAHRLSTVRGADRILVLHQGEIRESGTHQELLEMNGIYSRLNELQFSRAAGGG